MHEINIKNKKYSLPIFMPDATHASIKGLDSISLKECNIEGIVVNTYHLLNDDVVEIIEKMGGIKKFMNFDGLVITDSGGFQAMSLVRKNKQNGKMTEDGVIFKDYKSGKILNLTPEICIQTQIKLGSDIIMVLDDCTDPMESLNEQEKSVKRTIEWAKRCKIEFDKLTKDISTNAKPLLFGIIQGGDIKELRQKCAKGLIDIGFDGYAYGGWPMRDGILLSEILDYTCSLMPDDKPKYAMGVGKPQDMLACFKMGYNMFDCVIPTRDARHARFYIGDGLQTINISNEKYLASNSKFDESCNCFTCRNFSSGYLRHLYKVQEPVFFKLGSIHNLTVFARFIKNLLPNTE